MKLFILVSATVHILYIFYLVMINTLVEKRRFKWCQLIKTDSMLYFFSIVFCITIAFYYESYHGAFILISSLPIIILYMGTSKIPDNKANRK